MEDSDEAQKAADKWRACRRSLHPVFALVAGICLLALVGWIGEITGWLHWCTITTGFVFSVERTMSFWSRRHERQDRRRLTVRVILAILVFCGSVALLFQPSSGGSIGPHLFVLIAVLVSGLSLMISHQTRFTARAFHPGTGAHRVVSRHHRRRHLVAENAAVYGAGADLLVARRGVHQHQRGVRDRACDAESGDVFQHHGTGGHPAAHPDRRTRHHDAHLLRGGRVVRRACRCTTGYC